MDDLTKRQNFKEAFLKNCARFPMPNIAVPKPVVPQNIAYKIDSMPMRKQRNRRISVKKRKISDW
jgi:hypothetical protein